MNTLSLQELKAFFKVLQESERKSFSESSLLYDIRAREKFTNNCLLKIIELLESKLP